MAKPFEIRYAPDQWGNQYVNQGGAYGGLHVQAPANQLSPNFSPSLVNALLRNNAISSRPRSAQILPLPPDNTHVRGCGTFLDPAGNYHTFAITNTGLWELPAGALGTWNGGAGLNPWSHVSAQSLVDTQYYWQVFRNNLYFTSYDPTVGGIAHLSGWNGTNFVLDCAGSGALPFTTTIMGARFLNELDQHLLMAATAETTSGVTTYFPQRVRWSNIAWNPGATFGNLGTAAATFDPTVNVNAGFNDFIDVPDNITGLLMLGRVGYIIRANGVTELSPTGNGLAPFDFNHLWASERGIGNIFPDTLAQYGSMGIFVANDNIYMMTPSETKPIGGAARDEIITSIANRSITSTFAAITPRFSERYVYLTYVLITGENAGQNIYLYSIEDNNWTKLIVNAGSQNRPDYMYFSDQSLSFGPNV